jgi:hypothetical protein
MELSLTQEQKKYLDSKSLIKADALQRIYKKSVQDQQKMLAEADKIRNQRKKAKK